MLHCFLLVCRAFRLPPRPLLYL